MGEMVKKPTVSKKGKAARKTSRGKKRRNTTTATVAGSDNLATLSVLDGSMRNLIRDSFLKRSH